MPGRGCRSSVLPLMICAAAWLSGSVLWGAGFSAPDPGVKAMGLGGAFVARASDPTAGFYNPGGLALWKPRPYHLAASLCTCACMGQGSHGPGKVERACQNPRRGLVRYSGGRKR